MDRPLPDSAKTLTRKQAPGKQESLSNVVSDCAHLPVPDVRGSGSTHGSVNGGQREQLLPQNPKRGLCLKNRMAKIDRHGNKLLSYSQEAKNRYISLFLSEKRIF